MARKILKTLTKYALYIAFVQAWAAILGSVYFSEIVGLTPCRLCWYQRILMWPVGIITTVAIWRQDKRVFWYVLPLSVLGIGVALYQYLLQMTPLSIPTSCGLDASCEAIDFSMLGFITIPFLSLVAFIVITISMLLLLKSDKGNVKRA